MEIKHWTEEQLLAILYGVRSEEDAAKDAHFSRCAGCEARLRELRRRREAILLPVSLPENVVVAQRRAVMRRIILGPAAAHNGNGSFWITWWRPLASLAAVALLLIAIAIPRKDSRAVSTAAALSSDAKFFNEVMYEASRSESAALTPMHNLFQTETQTRAVRR